MSIEYDSITAYYYASYRPSLHDGILKLCLGNESFNNGLDIGCGTGQSSIALTNFCKKVIGIDSSAAMISKGIVHANVSYMVFNQQQFDFETNTFDMITLAGSLWYAKSENLLNEIVRVGTEHALVLVYDFEILLKDILDEIGFEKKASKKNPYNHEEDFTGLNTDKIMLIEKVSEETSLKIAISDLAHLILSVKEQYTSLQYLYGSDQLSKKIIDKLKLISNTEFFIIKAKTFATLYHLN